MNREPFAPVGAGQTISVTDATGTTEITLDASAPIARLANVGTSECFVSWGTGELDVSSTAFMVNILPGTVEVFTKDTATKLAAECATGATTTLRVVVGVGQ